MQTRLITTEEELLALKEDWNRLVQSNPETDMPFFSWDWFYLSWIHFGKPNEQELFVVAVYENERPVGILPLVRGQRKSSRVSYRSLGFCNVGMMPRNTIYYACFTAYDMKYREYSPGIVLLNYQLEHLSKEGGKIFDFCGTTYAYKEKYATGHQNHSTFQVFHTGLKSRFIFSGKIFWLPIFRRILRKPTPKDYITHSRHF